MTEFLLQNSHFPCRSTPDAAGTPGAPGAPEGEGGPPAQAPNLTSNRRLQQTQAQVDEVRTAAHYEQMENVSEMLMGVFIPQVVDIMRVNVDKVLERDQKLSELDDRADALQAGASQFESSAAKLKNKYWWKNCKVGVTQGDFSTLRSGDCGGCSNTLSSLSCSRNQLEIILVRGMRCAILLEAEYGCTVAIKRLAWSATMVRQAVVERCSSAYFSWNEQLLSYRWLAISSKQSGNAPLIYDIISNHYCSLDILCFMSFLNSRDACAGKSLWIILHIYMLQCIQLLPIRYLW